MTGVGYPEYHGCCIMDAVVTFNLITLERPVDYEQQLKLEARVIMMVRNNIGKLPDFASRLRVLDYLRNVVQADSDQLRLVLKEAVDGAAA